MAVPRTQLLRQHYKYSGASRVFNLLLKQERPTKVITDLVVVRLYIVISSTLFERVVSYVLNVVVPTVSCMYQMRLWTKLPTT